MQVAFFPPSTARSSDAAHPVESGASTGDTADTSFASLLDSNAGQSSAEGGLSHPVGDAAEGTDPAAVQPPLRKPVAQAAAELPSVPEFVTAAAALLDLQVPAAVPADSGPDATVSAEEAEPTAAEGDVVESIDGTPVASLALASDSVPVVPPLRAARETLVARSPESGASGAWPVPAIVAAEGAAPTKSVGAAAVAQPPAATPVREASSDAPAVGAPPPTSAAPAGDQTVVPPDLEMIAPVENTRQVLQASGTQPSRPAGLDRSMGGTVRATPAAPETAPTSGIAAPGQSPDLDSAVVSAPSPAAERMDAMLAAGGVEVTDSSTRPTVVPAEPARAAAARQAQGLVSPSVGSARQTESKVAPPQGEVAPLAANAVAAREAAATNQPSAVTAVRTLAQVLAENAPTTQPPQQAKALSSSASAPLAAATADEAPQATSAKALTSAVQPAALLAQTSNASTATSVPDSAADPARDFVGSASEGEADGETPAAPPSTRRTQPEFLAAGRARNGRIAGEIETSVRGKNSLGVDAHGVERSPRGLGTGIAKETQTMSVQTPVLPPVSAALDSTEPVAAGVSAAQTTAALAPKLDGEAHVVRSHAAELVRETLEVAERAQATGRNHVELRLPGGDGDLRVHLSWRDGVVHTKFVTHDVDLQQALSREWEHAAPKLAEKGLKFGEPSFENRDQSGQSAAQNASNFDQQRHSSRGQGQDGSERAPEFTLRPSASNTSASARRTAHTAATAAVASGKPTPAETRGLRAWA